MERIVLHFATYWKAFLFPEAGNARGAAPHVNACLSQNCKIKCWTKSGSKRTYHAHVQKEFHCHARETLRRYAQRASATTHCAKRILRIEGNDQVQHKLGVKSENDPLFQDERPLNPGANSQKRAARALARFTQDAYNAQACVLTAAHGRAQNEYSRRWRRASFAFARWANSRRHAARERAATVFTERALYCRAL